MADQVTIYNDNFALVRTGLELQFEKGLQNILYDEIPATLEANSVIIKPLSDDIQIFSQNFEYDLANTNQILQKYIGKNIEIITVSDQVFCGVLQFNDFKTLGILEKDTNRLILLQYSEIRNVNLTELPANFFLKPTLNWQVRAAKAGKQKMDFSYLCYNMKWDVTYNSVWNDVDELLEMNSWVTITNETGKKYQDVKLKLIAGEVQKQTPGFGRGYTDSVMYMKTAREPEFVEKEFHDFHLYTLSENVTINNNQTKQLRLFPSKKVKAAAHYTYQTSQKNVMSKIIFDNSVEKGLGMPLPKGIVKIYKLDKDDDQLEFIGEDNIDHTPVNEKVTITTGKAFDLVAETVVTDTRRITKTTVEKDMKVILKNHSKKEKKITVSHYISGYWTIQNNSDQYIKKSANNIEFEKKLKAGTEAVLTWTERIE
jgi:hypothetical protein